MLDVTADQAGNGFVNSLGDVLKPFCEGRCPVSLTYRAGTAEASITLGERWQVRPTDELLLRLKDLAGEQRVRVVY